MARETTRKDDEGKRNSKEEELMTGFSRLEEFMAKNIDGMPNKDKHFIALCILSDLFADSSLPPARKISGAMLTMTCLGTMIQQVLDSVPEGTGEAVLIAAMKDAYVAQKVAITGLELMKIEIGRAHV